MRVLVLGAGVVGTTAAWYLSKAGVEVEVVDRQPAAGLETSFANGAQISACHNEPWATPATLRKALIWLGREDAPLILRWRRWDPALWQWLARFLSYCNSAAARRHTERILRVSLYSRSCLQALRREIDLDYDLLAKGILTFFRDQAEFEDAARSLDATRQQGLDRRLISAAEAVAIEPALAAMGSALLGGIYSPDDESGDAFKFTQALAAQAEARGVRFHFDCAVHNLEWDMGRISGVATSQGRLRADVYLLCMGSWSPFIASQVGINLPIYPAKGYSATFPVIDPARLPMVSLIDEEHKVVYSRLGNRLRAAGTAELGGWNNAMAPVRSQKLVDLTRGQFGDAVDYGAVELWAGLRPVTPDSVPIIGASPVGNLFLNTGHGTLGWTMACGSGKLIADIICGTPPDIEIAGLGVGRFKSWWPTGAAE